MRRRALALLLAVIAFESPGVERSSQGSLLKSSPPPSKAAAPGKAPAPTPPAVTTPAIRLFGAVAPKPATATVHTTEPIRLWGSP